MTKNCDWYNPTFYSGKSSVPTNLTIQDMDQGIGYMNRRLQNLINGIIEYLAGQGYFERSQIQGIEEQFLSLSEKEFKSKSFGEQVGVVVNFGKTMLPKEYDSLEQIRKDRNYFIHKFDAEYSKNGKIEDNQFLRLKKTISSIDKAAHRFEDYVKQERSKKKKKKASNTKKVPEEEMKRTIMNLINSRGGRMSIDELDLELRNIYGTIEWGTWYGYRYQNCLIEWGFVKRN